MGIIRKTTSVLTVGAIDFRSDKERIAKYTKATAQATRATARQAHAQTQILAAAQAPLVPSASAPQWLPDPQSQARLRYWDGAQWTAHLAP